VMDLFWEKHLSGDDPHLTAKWPPFFCFGLTA
jgi:hypothetical protein